MRDYDFGNFLSILRERRGLSQYQLGVLAGVSDKAVSKWENGVSKPRLNTMQKLAQILDVSVDELLTCENNAFDNKKRNLFTMKKNIIKTAKNELKYLYGDDIPLVILNRFNFEKMALQDSDCLLWMSFYGKLQEKLKAKDIYMEIRDSQIQESFIAWLLGGTNINPLPAHYYCPHCKKIEFSSSARCGTDLPDKMCSCNKPYLKDGYGLDTINMYPLPKWHEIHTPKLATQDVISCLKDFFSEVGTLHEIEIKENNLPESTDTEPYAHYNYRFIIVPHEINKRLGNDKIIAADLNEYFDIFRDFSGITIVGNNTKNIGNITDSGMNLSQEQLTSFYNYAIKNDIFENKYLNINLSKIYLNIKNPTFDDLINIFSISNGTGIWEDNAEYLYDYGIPLNKLISNREDVYAYLYDILSKKCCDNPAGLAFEIKESLRKGKYANNRMPKEIETLLSDCGVPDWYIDSMKKIMYLPSKAYIIMLLKKEFAKYLKLV